MQRLYLLAPRVGPFLGVALLVAAWYAATAGGLATEKVLPAPQDVLARFAADVVSPQVWQNIGITIQAWFLAAPIGYLLGVAIALLLATWTSMQRWLHPYLILANSVPRVVLAPVFILALGLGLGSRVALGVSLIVFPVALGVYGGFRLCDPVLVNSVSMFGAGKRALWMHVRLPAALPYLVSNWRLAASLGLLGAIVGEILIAPNGLGWLIRTRSGIFDVAGVFSVLVIILALALIVNLASDRVAARLLRWQ
jgi:NitT/TauT family transport system permease protein